MIGTLENMVTAWNLSYEQNRGRFDAILAETAVQEQQARIEVAQREQMASRACVDAALDVVTVLRGLWREEPDQWHTEHGNEVARVVLPVTRKPVSVFVTADSNKTTVTIVVREKKHRFFFGCLTAEYNIRGTMRDRLIEVVVQSCPELVVQDGRGHVFVRQPKVQEDGTLRGHETTERYRDELQGRSGEDRPSVVRDLVKSGAA